jgi:tRNA (mo5U34)-methyltransferase
MGFAQHEEAVTMPFPLGSSFDQVEARQTVARVNAAGGTYHRLDFGDGLVIEGEYDIRKYLPYYHLPERLDGVHVLDVGTASGYFAIECDRRGAEVTALDIYPDDCLLAELAKTFDLGIDYVSKSVYDLDPSFGQFELVICGSLLLHLPDPVGALRALRQVTSGRLVLSTAAIPDSATTEAPVCNFFGQRAVDGDYWAYWGFSAAALTRMLLAARFSHIDNVEHFDLVSEAGRTPYFTPHVALSAYA